MPFVRGQHIASEERAKAHEQGYSAYENGKSRKDNPYDKGVMKHEWELGWYNAQDTKREEKEQK